MICLHINWSLVTVFFSPLLCLAQRRCLVNVHKSHWLLFLWDCNILVSPCLICCCDFGSQKTMFAQATNKGKSLLKKKKKKDGVREALSYPADKI